MRLHRVTFIAILFAVPVFAVALLPRRVCEVPEVRLHRLLRIEAQPRILDDQYDSYFSGTAGVEAEKREARYAKKFQAGRRYILKELFSWLPPATKIRQIAVFISHPRGRDSIAEGVIVSIDELMAEIRGQVVACGPMVRNAISEQFPLLRTIQTAQAGYYRIIEPDGAANRSQPIRADTNRTPSAGGSRR